MGNPSEIPCAPGRYGRSRRGAGIAQQHTLAKNEKLFVKGLYQVQIPGALNQTAHKPPGVMSVLSTCDTQQLLQDQAGNRCTEFCAPFNLSAATPESCSCTKLSLLSIFRLSQRWLEHPTLQQDPSSAQRAHQGHLFPSGEPCHAQEHSGRWPQAPGGRLTPMGAGGRNAAPSSQGWCPGDALLTMGATCCPPQGIWAPKMKFPLLVPPTETLAVAQRSASGLASYLWRRRAVLRNEESWASFQLGMQTAGCLQNGFSRFGAARLSCETSWLNQARADTVRAVGSLPGEQSPLQEGEDNPNPCPFNASWVDDL